MQVHLHPAAAAVAGDMVPPLADPPPVAGDGFLGVLTRVMRDSAMPAAAGPPAAGADEDMAGAGEALADGPASGMTTLPADPVVPDGERPAPLPPEEASRTGGLALAVPGHGTDMAGPVAADVETAGLFRRKAVPPLRPSPSPQGAADGGRIGSQGAKDGSVGPSGLRFPPGPQGGPVPDRVDDDAMPAASTKDGPPGDSRPAMRGRLIQPPAGPPGQTALPGDVRVVGGPATGDVEQARLAGRPHGVIPTGQDVQVAAGSSPALAAVGGGDSVSVPALPNAALVLPGQDAVSQARASAVVRQGMDRDSSTREGAIRSVSPALPSVPADAGRPEPDARKETTDPPRAMVPPPQEMMVAAAREGPSSAMTTTLPSPVVPLTSGASSPAWLAPGGPLSAHADAAFDAGAVLRQVAFAVRSQVPGITEIHLDPPELGALRLDLRTNGAVASLVIGAERPEAMDLVRSGLHGLAGELRALGFERVEISFDHGSRDSGARADPGGDGRAGADARPAADGAARAAHPADPAPPDPVAIPSPAPRQPAGAGLDIRL